MPFEGLGQSLYDDAKMICYIDIFSLLLSKNQTIIGDVITKLHITEEEFYLVANEISTFNRNDKHEEYQQMMRFRMKHQCVLRKMKKHLIT